VSDQVLSVAQIMRADFLQRHQSLPLRSEVGVEVRFITERRQIELAIVINENTGIKDMEVSWAFIDDWRKRLIDYQGPFLQISDDGHLYGKTVILITLWRNKQSRSLTWVELAQLANDEITEMLREHIEQLDEYAESKAKDEMSFENWIWTTDETYNYGLALDWLKACGVKEKDDVLYVEDAILNIRQGKPAFPLLTPITANMVRRRIDLLLENYPSYR